MSDTLCDLSISQAGVDGGGGGGGGERARGRVGDGAGRELNMDISTKFRIVL